MRTLKGRLALAAGGLVLLGCSSGGGAKPPGAAGSGPAGATAGSGGGAAGTGVDAAGDPGATDAGAARLVPWQLEADGTDPLVMGIYDLKEKVHCRFLPDEGGQLRCLPWALATFTETATFSDAACTKRIYTTDDATGAAWVDRPTAVPLPRSACAPYRYAVVTLKALPAPAPHFGGASCATLDPAPDPGFGRSEVTVADVLAAERWEKGTAADGPLVGGRMRVKLAQAPDGARFAHDLVDERWNRPCHLIASGNDVFCQPNAPTDAVGQAGAGCSGPAVWRAHACDDPPFLIASFSGTEGLMPGGLWDGPVSRAGKGCNPVAPSSTIYGPDVFIQAGPVVTDARMPPRPWRPAGTGRLRVRGLADDTGKVVALPAAFLWPEFDGAVIQGAHARYFDAVADTTCNPIRTPEGQLRCVPTSTALALGPAGFADDACTAPVFFCPGYAAACPGILAMKAAPQTNGEVRAESINTTRPVTTVFLSATGACMPTAAGGPGVFALGPEASWAQFPAFTERNGRAPGAP